MLPGEAKGGRALDFASGSDEEPVAAGCSLPTAKQQRLSRTRRLFSRPRGTLRCFETATAGFGCPTDGGWDRAHQRCRGGRGAIVGAVVRHDLGSARSDAPGGVGGAIASGGGFERRARSQQSRNRPAAGRHHPRAFSSILAQLAHLGGRRAREGSVAVASGVASYATAERRTIIAEYSKCRSVQTSGSRSSRARARSCEPFWTTA